LRHATSRVFTEGAHRVVVIGTDSPWISEREIKQAFAALQEHDLVIGPSRDGGYYLLGLASPTPCLFEGIAWSTPKVLAQTLAVARRHRLSVHHLPLGYDVDRLADWRDFLKEEIR
jgi:hypothetical protein